MKMDVLADSYKNFKRVVANWGPAFVIHGLDKSDGFVVSNHAEYDVGKQLAKHHFERGRGPLVLYKAKYDVVSQRYDFTEARHRPNWTKFKHIEQVFRPGGAPLSA